MSRQSDHSAVPLLVRVGLAARRRDRFEVFGADHMALLRTGPEGLPETVGFERWITLAAPSFWPITCGELRSGGFDGDDRVDAFQWAVARLWSKCVGGAFAGEARVSEAGLVLTAFRRLVRDWRRSVLARRRHEVRIAPPSDDHAPTVDPRAESQDELRERVRAALQMDLTRTVIESWRSWPTAPMRRLVLACTVCPDDVTRDDLAAALGSARTLTVRLRPADEAWPLLERWLAKQAADEEPHDVALAFALRGPEGVDRLDHWGSGERRSAVAWLWKLRQRAQDDLANKLACMGEV